MIFIVGLRGRLVKVKRPLRNHSERPHSIDRIKQLFIDACYKSLLKIQKGHFASPGNNSSCKAAFLKHKVPAFHHIEGKLTMVL